MKLFFILQMLVTIPMLPRDIGFGYNFWRVNKLIAQWSSKGWTIHQIFDDVVKAHPNKLAIRLEDQAWTFKELQDYSYKIANYFKNNGFQEKNKVALLMENRLEYIGVWLGLSRIGIVTALVNITAKGTILIHAVSKATQGPCDAIIVSAKEDLFKAFEDAYDAEDQVNKMPVDWKIYVLGGKMPSTRLTKTIIHLDPELTNKDLVKPIDESISKKLNINSNMVYVYTSGTEGFPKAAVFDFERFIRMATGTHYFLGIKSKDVLYNPMQLFHASGGLIGTGQMLLYGLTMIIKEKFSARGYFPDCKKYGATVGQYIGEICSFVWATDKSPADRDHNIRLMFGNGMRRKIWKGFQDRFNVRQIGEFYGSTEGNANLVNINNKVGAVGFLPWYATSLYPIELIEYDTDTSEPKRGTDGLCIRATRQGLLVGKSKTGFSKIKGYASEEETKKKLIPDVFEKGDLYFNSGDVLERDIFGYYYFVDRLGDTFRWKGENIAASQVEDVIIKGMGYQGSHVVSVYGVEVKDQEGRAGMACFEMNVAHFKMPQFEELVDKKLGGPWIPVFIRFTDKFPLTVTQKIQKSVLKNEGFNPGDMKDPEGKPIHDQMYYYNSKTKKYEPLTQEAHDDILKKKIKI
ncbi:long-chain fatty acid transport protein 4-like [Macrosteles quadrilineatus]|uniref:long-chain fatty acid transport protein 4-like n=1 Tax=Macrosteles quadrilineatus TaxID=74068 RepID=UPI0023E18413|nr:long-chain fatty acid transport protein 4-like [Macrosteles quadrilineatus]